MKVRCNHCMAIFDEEDITVDANDKEHCPKCGAEGYLMDLTTRRTYVHELDTAPSYLTGVKVGFKRALFIKEVLKFNVTEQIILRGYDAYFRKYTGDECIVRITDIMRRDEYNTSIPEGWIILSIEVIP